jgi:hypothetical protein
VEVSVRAQKGSGAALLGLLALVLPVGGSGQGHASYVHSGDMLLVVDPTTQALLVPHPLGASGARTVTGFMHPQMVIVASGGNVRSSDGGGQAVVIDSGGDVRTFPVNKDAFGAANPKKAIVLAFPGSNEGVTGTSLTASLGPAPAGGAGSGAALNGSAGATGGGGASSGGGGSGGGGPGGGPEGQAVAASGHPGAPPSSGGGAPPSDGSTAVARFSPLPIGSGPGAGSGPAVALPNGGGNDLATHPGDGGNQQGPSQSTTLAADPTSPRSTVPGGTDPAAGSPLGGLLTGADSGQKFGADDGAVLPSGDDPLLPVGSAAGRDPDPSQDSASDGGGAAYPAVGGGGSSLPADADPVPEPASLTLLSIGALGLLSYGWRKRRGVQAAS